MDADKNCLSYNLTFYHFLLGKYVSEFTDINKKSSNISIINEVPTIVLIGVVFVVIFKPL